jgi:hypothetical protein
MDFAVLARPKLPTTPEGAFVVVKNPRYDFRRVDGEWVVVGNRSDES